MKLLQNLTILALVVIFTGCETTRTRIHPDTPDRLIDIEKVVIIPAEINVELITLTGENEPLPEVELEIRQEVVNTATQKLQEAGFTVVDFDLSAQIEADPMFASHVEELRTQAALLTEEVKLGRPLPVEEAHAFRASVGEIVNEISSVSGADALLYITSAGFQKSDGLIASELALSVAVAFLGVVSVPVTEGISHQVFLFDGVTGDLLWADISSSITLEEQAHLVFETLPLDTDAPVDASNENANTGATGAAASPQ